MQNQVFTLYSEEYHMLLRFNPQQESFSIYVQNKHTNQIYYQTVDSEFLQRENFGCNADATDFFNYLYKNQEVSFENGTLRFKYVWGKPLKKERKIQIALIRDQVSYLKNELRVAHDQIKRLQNIIITNIESHPDNLNSKYFSTSRQGSDSYVKIKCLLQSPIKQGQYYNFINKSEIRQKKRVTYSIILSDCQLNIMLGLCTKDCMNQQNNYKHSQSVYYDLSQKSIWIYGKRQQLNQITSPKRGDVVLIQMDLVDRLISFWKNGIELKIINLYESLKGKSFYFSALMINPNDQIHVSALIIKENDQKQVNSK